MYIFMDLSASVTLQPKCGSVPIFTGYPMCGNFYWKLSICETGLILCLIKGDFGISKLMDQTIDVASTCVGTPCYLSPEMCQDIPYSSKADVWVCTVW